MIQGRRKEPVRMKCTNFNEESDVISIQLKKYILAWDIDNPESDNTKARE